MKYDAFISYRHCEPDKSIAESIHRKLEAYRLPVEVAAKIGRRKLDRIFRDEAELAVSNDLSEVIMAALQESEYLIVICTPRLQLSEWCKKEIEIFLTIRDRRHILLVLAEGEPDEVFPEILTYEDVCRRDMDGNEVHIREKREPLAADCRGETGRERRVNMYLTILRLAASILGLEFDELRQRHRVQRARRRAVVVLTVFLIIFVMLAQSIYFLKELNRQNRMIREKYEDTITSVSERLLEDGRRMDAIYAARSILPDRIDSGYNAAAVRALVAAEGLYTSPQQYQCDSILPVPATIRNVDLSDDGSLIGVTGANDRRYIIDTSTGEVLYDYPEEEGVIAFDGRDGILCHPEGEGIVYVDLGTGKETAVCEQEADLFTLPEGQGCILVTESSFARYHKNEMVFEQKISDPGIESDVGKFYPSVFFSPDGLHAILTLCDYTDGRYAMYQFSTADGKTEACISGEGYLDSAATDGDTIVYSVATYEDYSNTSDVFTYDVAKQEEYFFRSFEGDYFSDICINNGLALLAGDTKAVMYDPEKGSINSFGLKSFCQMMFPMGDGVGIMDYDGGLYQCTKDSYLYYQVTGREKNENFFCYGYRGGRFFFASFGEDEVQTYARENSPYCTPCSSDEVEMLELPSGITDEQQKFMEAACAFNSEIDPTAVLNCLFSTDGKYGVIQLWNMDVWIYDLENMQPVRVLYACSSVCIRMLYLDQDGVYYLSAGDTYVLNDRIECVIRIKGMTAYGTNTRTGELVLMDADADCYTIRLLGYEEVVQEADRILGNYEPKPSVRERYGF